MPWLSLPERTLNSVPTGTGSKEGIEKTLKEGQVLKGDVSGAQLWHSMRTKLGRPSLTVEMGVQCTLNSLVSESSGIGPESRAPKTTLESCELFADFCSPYICPCPQTLPTDCQAHPKPGDSPRKPCSLLLVPGLSLFSQPCCSSEAWLFTVPLT